MKRLFFVLSLAPFVAALAEVPTCNLTEEDTALFQQKTAREFFAARATQTECVKKYEVAKAQFVAARAALVKSVADKAAAPVIDAAEKRVDELREPFGAALAECGPCAMNPITEPTEIPVPGGKTQIWYKTDGSCQLPSTDRAELSKSFDKLSSILTHLHQFPRKPGIGGGFNSIMQLSAYDPKDGRLIPEVDALVEGENTSLFLAVKGPHETGFSYYFNDRYDFSKKGGVRQFNRKGVAIAPVGFVPPRTLKYTTAAGKIKSVLNSSLKPGSSTSWYLNEEGYIRYCGTADFGLKSAFTKDFGRVQMLDLLATALERAQ